MNTLNKLKKAGELLSEVIAENLNENSKKKWYKFTLHSKGILQNAIKDLEKEEIKLKKGYGRSYGY